jgi:hypothetical protein
VRRLVALVGCIVLVDTMFYAAITPLLPELTRELLLTALYAVTAAWAMMAARPGWRRPPSVPLSP